MATALIVDDDSDFNRMMASLVSHHGFTASTAPSLRAARRQMASSQPDLVLLDLMLPDGDGLSLLDDTELVGQSEVVLMTGHASLETSIRALRHGAADYLVKPVSDLQLQGILSRVAKPRQAAAQVEQLHAQLQRSGRFGALVGRSGRMELVYEQIARVARTSVAVFIQGETGTGKELTARTVHELSRRQAEPYVVVNCGSISAELLEGELFGRQGQPGLLERAHRGTLFLDEICEIPVALQARLLRVLETGTFSRAGSAALRETDVRVISATHRDPARAVADGALRQDLFYRLNVFPIELPPLRDRMEDIPLLARHLLRDIAGPEGVIKQAAPEALQRLAQYRWPGNVRELRNSLQQTYLMTAGREIRHPWLPRDAAPPVAPRQRGVTFEVAAGTTLAQMEREAILATLERCGQHKARTAAALGISAKTLYNRLKSYGL